MTIFFLPREEFKFRVRIMSSKPQSILSLSDAVGFLVDGLELVAKLSPLFYIAIGRFLLLPTRASYFGMPSNSGFFNSGTEFRKLIESF